MKKLSIISIIAVSGIALVSCSDVRRSPGRAYMPDMAYSRAYETYAMTAEHKAELAKQGIYFSNTPVPGTVKRGVDFTFRIPKDKAGDSTHYVASKAVQNPIVMLDSNAMKESERMYLIHCGICHGTALDGNGPLYKGGAGPYPAAPKNLMTLAMPDGQMFYSVTYGKGAMGSYASQLNSTQRWMIIKYIKAKQAGASAGTTAPAADSTAAGTGGRDTTAAAR